MKICICDDEKNILEQIKNFLKPLNEKGIIKTFYDSNELQKEIKKENVDILFMDIKLKEVNGTKFIKENEKYLKNTKLIYITGYDEYIEDTFLSDPIYVLRKPLTEDKIIKAYKKAVLKIKSENIDVLFKTAKETVKIKLDDILYIESKGRLIDIHTTSGVKSLYYKLADIEILYSKRFIRIHKSFLVNLNKISSYKYNKVILENKEELIISRTYQKSCKEDIMSFMESNND